MFDTMMLCTVVVGVVDTTAGWSCTMVVYSSSCTLPEDSDIVAVVVVSKNEDLKLLKK